MPVIFEQIDEPSSQDYSDLAKIYQDTPELTQENPNQWIDDSLKNGRILLAGRFNGRIVGCVWATQTRYDWRLEHLAVRDITRRRGVARQLLTLLTKRANANKVNLSAENTPTCDMMHSLLLELGFSLTTSDQSSLWQKNHQP